MTNLEDLVHLILQEEDNDLEVDESLDEAVTRFLIEDEEEEEEEIIQIGGRGDINPVQVHLDFNGRSFDLRSHWVYHNERFGIDGIAYNFVVSPNFSPTEVFESFDRLISEIYDFMRSSFHPNDYVEVFVTSNEFRDGGFSIPLIQVKD